MTDVELDERVTALEENGGGNNPQNGKLSELMYALTYFSREEGDLYLLLTARNFIF